MSKRINIIIVEPSVIIRCGVVSILRQLPSLSCSVSESGDLASVTSAGDEEFDLLIINPSLLGLFTPSQIRSDFGNESLKIIALQSAIIDQSILQNYDDSISIYDSADSISEKISAASRIKESDSKRELSQREKEIIVYVVKGMTNKQIADALYISTHTVIAHRRNISSKLQIHSSSGLTIYAIVNKLVNLAEVKRSITQNTEEE